jgi:hypothetical protein
VVVGVIDAIAKRLGASAARSLFSNGSEAENGHGKCCSYPYTLRKSLLWAMIERVQS